MVSGLLNTMPPDSDTSSIVVIDASNPLKRRRASESKSPPDYETDTARIATEQLELENANMKIGQQKRIIMELEKEAERHKRMLEFKHRQLETCMDDLKYLRSRLQEN